MDHFPGPFILRPAAEGLGRGAGGVCRFYSKEGRVQVEFQVAIPDAPREDCHAVLLGERRVECGELHLDAHGRATLRSQIQMRPGEINRAAILLNETILLQSTAHGKKVDQPGLLPPAPKPKPAYKPPPAATSAIEEAYRKTFEGRALPTPAEASPLSLPQKMPLPPPQMDPPHKMPDPTPQMPEPPPSSMIIPMPRPDVEPPLCRVEVPCRRFPESPIWTALMLYSLFPPPGLEGLRFKPHTCAHCPLSGGCGQWVSEKVQTDPTHSPKT